MQLRSSTHFVGSRLASAAAANVIHAFTYLYNTQIDSIALHQTLENMGPSDVKILEARLAKLEKSHGRLQCECTHSILYGPVNRLY